VVNYTNAPFLVSAEFKAPGELNGLCSGYDHKARNYEVGPWRGNRQYMTKPASVLKKRGFVPG
jgi:hypothetical protein